jgi:NitT/TauT family transport system ATP-binding protein
MTRHGRLWETAFEPSGRSVSVAADTTQNVSLENVSVHYGRRDGEPALKALDGVSFQVSKGEFVAVLGPSGCGKSTLVRVISGLLPPSEGNVYVQGQPVTAPRRDVGIVFQDPTLLPWRSVFENVMLPASIQGLERKRSAERARTLLEVVGLSAFSNAYPHELSGGMRQRAGIARALLSEPSIILMDEPFGALDAMTRERMNLEILRIWSKTSASILFITHSIPEAVLLSDRIVLLSSRPGRIAKIIENDLPRPRDLTIMATPQFGRLVVDLRAFFEAVGQID